MMFNYIAFNINISRLCFIYHAKRVESLRGGVPCTFNRFALTQRIRHGVGTPVD